MSAPKKQRTLSLWLGQPEHFTEAFCVTFGNGAENERTMEIIQGSWKAEAGWSVEQVRMFAQRFAQRRAVCEFYELGQLFDGSTPEATLLVVRKGVNALLGHPNAHSDIVGELQRMPKDVRKLDQNSKVVNSLARHSNTMADYSQEPNIANGKGTVIDFKDWAKHKSPA